MTYCIKKDFSEILEIEWQLLNRPARSGFWVNPALFLRAITTKKTLIRLHGNGPFDRGAKVRWLLNEMGVTYEDHWLDADRGHST
jgi:hypothetical protein